MSDETAQEDKFNLVVDDYFTERCNTGMSGRRPSYPANRAECAAILLRVLNMNDRDTKFSSIDSVRELEISISKFHVTDHSRFQDSTTRVEDMMDSVQVMARCLADILLEK